MTIKIQIYQEYGIKTDKLIDEMDFCCWDGLYNYLKGFPILHKCPDCKKGIHK